MWMGHYGKPLLIFWMDMVLYGSSLRKVVFK